MQGKILSPRQRYALVIRFREARLPPEGAYVYPKHQIKQEPKHNYWRETNSDLSSAKVLHQK
jgi:hypothetical protein